MWQALLPIASHIGVPVRLGSLSCLTEIHALSRVELLALLKFLSWIIAGIVDRPGWSPSGAFQRDPLLAILSTTISIAKSFISSSFSPICTTLSIPSPVLWFLFFVCSLRLGFLLCFGNLLLCRCHELPY